MVDYKVWFTADLHINHNNILAHQSSRVDKMGLLDKNDIIHHDEFIINKWLEQTNKNDHIYVLGDMIMGNAEYSYKILNILKSNGCKIHLIVGNHDKSIRNMTNMFESIDLIKEVTFKKYNFDFLNNDFNIVMCHYPMKSWNGKCNGTMQLYGHVHANSLWIDESDDLCLNVGIDNPLCNYSLFSLEDVYSYYLEKLNGVSPSKYSDIVNKTNKLYIR